MSASFDEGQGMKKFMIWSFTLCYGDEEEELDMGPLGQAVSVAPGSSLKQATFAIELVVPECWR